ncbi:transcriptional regulator [Ameyamaea chiangmaiensis NBRC 103196]|uniref:Lrp/AsnC ligand binding domain-containing protein n=1 Tax=Ameyamaea chiangmaiensis TaxID=442969 RepID=A0A850PBS1_9PROT|nr:Lrp/AsnC ligand binding domain-containing protein [Ameyamaea chiangmaiensis]MBS4074251.1 Lrp/AsnC ligand binding domain-containing protein [Ameyamaea chiangmaiensis]NVN41985.1 Lrp/AsnC ligand binding domain-containing protein [Ameyamaea chiangmaiensis]GBQ71380.1 transcriptional regulator [Ameyamaea chiangmaiensis NBRC 103196]
MIDDIDRKILKILQKDGRITNVDLARRINLSAAATYERVRRLQADGVIDGYAARLNPEKLNRALLIFVQITLEHTNEQVLEEFARLVRTIPDILECHMVAGGFDYLIKTRVRDMAAYRIFLGRTLSRLPGIRQTHTYSVIEEVKTGTDLPL